MKIKAVRAYQSVPFGGKEVTHLSSEMNSGKRGGKVTLEEVKGVGVKVKSEKDSIIVPFANCACIVLEDSKMVTSFKATANSQV